MEITRTGYLANYAKLFEMVKVWRLSELGTSLYKEPTKRIAEGDSLVDAPWLNKVTETASDVSEDDAPVRTGWYNESAQELDGQFDDIAEAFDREDFGDLLYALSSDSAYNDGILKDLEENEGKILLIAKPDSDRAFAVQYQEGAFFAAEIELDEDLNSMALIARTAAGKGDPRAPIVPGYVPIPLYPFLQQKMYEVLHSANVLLNSLKESKGSEIYTSLLEYFTKDLSEAIAELILDEGNLTDSESNSLFEAFAGAFTGIHEKVLSEEPSKVIVKYVTEAKKRAK